MRTSRLTSYGPVIAALCLLAGCQDAPKRPDYTQAGEDGDVPLPYSKMDLTSEEVDVWRVALPPTLTCGNDYLIGVDTRQDFIRCQGYDYTSIYNRATETLDARVASVSCPADNSCPQKYSWVASRVMSCGPSSPGGTVSRASVAMQRGVKCLPAGAPATPPGLQGTPTLTQPGAEPPGTPPPNLTLGTSEAPDLSKVSEASVQWVGDYSQAGRPALACPSRNRLLTVVRETVASCAAILNFEPFVTRARQSAQQLYDEARCLPGCTKTAPMNVLKHTWRCEDGTAGTVTGKLVMSFELAVDCTAP